MNDFVRLVVLLASALATSTTAAANTDAYIKLQLDSSQVFSGDIVVLDVESTGLLDPIDFSLIEQNATLLRESTGTRIAVIGGKVQEIAIRRMDLEPRQPGVMVIGPLTAGDIVSNTVTLNVLDAQRPSWTPDTSDAQIITSLTPDNASVNQQMLFTVELLHRYPINRESITLPDLAGFSKRVLIENRRSYKGDDKDWFRTQWQTFIYPRKSGTLEIGAIEWSGTLAKSNVERAEFSRRSRPVSISIASAPAEANDWWLPAKSVLMSDSWSSPPTSLSAGDEIERTITVEATNVLAGQIPVPTIPESRAIVQTPINSTRREKLTAQGVVSTADFVYRVTAQSPIPVFLDTVRINWWDTEQELSRDAIIPARRINVGLPDRADVLSKLALEESGLSRLRYQLRTINPLRFFSYIAAAIALLYVLWQALPSIWSRSELQSKLDRHLRQLKKLARLGDAPELYKTLKTPQSRHLLNGTEHDLIQNLESYLFRDATEQVNPPLEDWLKPVANRARQRKYLHEKGGEDALVGL